MEWLKPSPLRGRLLKLVYVGAVLIGLYLLVRVGYDYEWTHFDEYTNAKGETEPAKALWDWLDLLIIPAILAFGGFWFSVTERRAANRIQEKRAKNQQEIARDRLQESALQMYLDRMTDLLLKEKLRKSKPDSEVRDTARTRTLTVLRGLDGNRKGVLLQFLAEADLIKREKTVIDLRRADLSDANLSNLDLSAACLIGVNLKDADLRGAILVNADLFDANLSGADLGDAILVDADLSEANLEGARNTNPAQLASVGSLENAIMPNGTKYN